MPESVEEESSRPWDLIDLRECLQDSPGFRRTLAAKEQEIADLEMKVEKVVHFCTKMVDSGQAYMATCRMFASTLRELSHHFTTMNSVQNALVKFCEALNELQTSYSILFDQAKNAVAKGLRGFLTGDLKKAKDSKKVFHRVSEELNNAIHKNAQVSKHKPLEAEEASTILQTNFTEFTHQSLDYCYQLNALSCIKGHEIVDKLLQFMGAQSSCLNQGLDTLKELDPYLRQLTQDMEELQQTSETEIQNMQNRHNMVTSQQLEECLEQPTVSLDNPAASIELSGYLFKKASTGFRLWNRRYFVLKDNKLVYLKKESDHSHTGQNEYGVVAEDLRICTVKQADDLERRFCFEVVTPVRSCMLQADSEAMRRKWCSHLEAGIARALRGTTSNRRKEELKESQRHDSALHRFDSPVFNPRSDTPSSIQSNYSLGLDFLDVPGNDLCADCNMVSPKWASINLGIVLCIECSGIHRSLGVHISKVRSLTLDDWEPEQQKIMCALGNTRVNGILEYDIPKHVKKPTQSSMASERETYIKQKYVLKAFVHPHPNFERPEIPVPPPKVQGTLLSAAAANSSPRSPRGGTSPLASRPHHSAILSSRTSRTLNLHTRPFSLAGPPDGQSSFTESLPALSTQSIPSLHVENSIAENEMGGIRPESMALLEANWKKLEKSGKMQKWNFSRVTSVRPPKMNFSFTKFARPGSFRRRKITKDSEFSYSDNELDRDGYSPLATRRNRSGLEEVSASNKAPPKPPRTYTTMPSDLDEQDKSASSLFSDEKDDFSSDLLNTFNKLGSVYSLSAMLNEDSSDQDSPKKSSHEIQGVASHSALHLPTSNGSLPQKTGLSLLRSASAMSSLAVEAHSSNSPRGSSSLQTSVTYNPRRGEQEERVPTMPIRMSNSSDCLLLDTSSDLPPMGGELLQNRSLSMDSLEVLKDDDCLYQKALQTMHLHTLPRRKPLLPPSPISLEATFVHPPPPESQHNGGSPPKAAEGVDRVDGPKPKTSLLPLSQRRDNPVMPIMLAEESARRSRIHSSGSLDSFTSAQDNPFASSHSPSPDYSSTVDAFIRPDSSASELFETPPNSLDSPSPLRKAVEANMSLFPSISLQEDSGSSESFHARELSDATVTVGCSLSDSTGDERPVANDASDDSHTPYSSPQRKRRSALGSNFDDVFGTSEDATLQRDGTLPLNSTVIAELSAEDSSSASLDKEETDLDAATECDLLVPSGRQSQDSSFEPVVIPDSVHPTTFLFECSQTTDLPNLLCALVHGAVINQADQEEGGRYPVHQACLAGNDMVVEFLYQNGAKMNVVDSRNCTPLHLAAMNDDASLVALLLKRGANHLETDKDGKKPLEYALERENADTVTLLRLVEVNAQTRSEGSEMGHKFMSETMAGVYKDIAVATVADPERMKRRSLSSICSTPPSGGSSHEEVPQSMPPIMDNSADSSPHQVLGDHPPSVL